jgi:hypothetical protein
MPPTRTTNSCPIARQASGATCTAMLDRLSPVMKNGDASVMMTTRRTRISAGPSRMTRSATLSVFSDASVGPCPTTGAALAMNDGLPDTAGA